MPSSKAPQSRDKSLERKWLITAVLLVAVVMLLGTGPGATGAATHLPPVSVTVDRTALLVDGGQAVQIGVLANCAPGLTILEAFVTVSQEGVSSGFGGFSLPCDGRPHRVMASVPAFDSTFSRGDAFASGFLLAIDGGGNTFSDGDSHPVFVVGRD